MKVSASLLTIIFSFLFLPELLGQVNWEIKKPGTSVLLLGADSSGYVYASGINASNVWINKYDSSRTLIDSATVNQSIHPTNWKMKISKTGDIYAVYFGNNFGRIYVFDSDLNLKWQADQVQGGIYPNTQICDVAIDGDGNLFLSEVNFSRIFVYLDYVITNDTGFVVKYNASDGSVAWTHFHPYIEAYISLSIDNKNNIYASGNTNKGFPLSYVQYDHLSNILRLTKISSSGLIKWSITYVKSNSLPIESKAVPTSSNYFYASTVYGFGPYYLTFMKVKKNDGTIIWANTVDSGGDMSMKDAILDHKSRLVTYSYQGNSTTSKIWRYNPNGTLKSVNVAANSGEWSGDIDVLADNTVLLAGSKGNIHAFCRKISVQGSTLWTHQGNATPVQLFGSALSPDGSYYVGGNSGGQRYLVSFNGNAEVKLLSHDVFSIEATIYPNPCGDFINVKVHEVPDYPVEVEIYDVVGVKIEGQKILNDLADNSIKLDVSNFDSGIYFLRIQTSAGTVVKTFVKQ